MSENNPLISVIIPAFNAGGTIKKTLYSISSQEHKNLEIIVVNDGSTDNTAKQVENVASEDSRIRLINQENQGVTSARLNGVKHSTGEWIGFVDSDDEIESDMYSRLLANALGHEADISHCGYQIIADEGNRRHYFYNTGKTLKQDNISGLQDLLSGEFIEPGLCNKLFRRKLFDDLIQDGFIDTTIKINEDLLMNYYLFKQADGAYYEDFCPYHYISVATSASRSGDNVKKIYDVLKVWDTIATDIQMLAGKADTQSDTENNDTRDYGRLLDTINTGYVGRYIAAYMTFMENGMNEEAKRAKSEILSRKSYWHLLGLGTRIRAKMICYCPKVYALSDRLYTKHFQKVKYE